MFFKIAQRGFVGDFFPLPLHFRLLSCRGRLCVKIKCYFCYLYISSIGYKRLFHIYNTLQEIARSKSGSTCDFFVLPFLLLLLPPTGASFNGKQSGGMDRLILQSYPLPFWSSHKERSGAMASQRRVNGNGLGYSGRAWSFERSKR